MKEYISNLYYLNYDTTTPTFKPHPSLITEPSNDKFLYSLYPAISLPEITTPIKPHSYPPTYARLTLKHLEFSSITGDPDLFIHHVKNDIVSTLAKSSKLSGIDTSSINRAIHITSIFKGSIIVYFTIESVTPEDDTNTTNIDESQEIVSPQDLALILRELVELNRGVGLLSFPQQTINDPTDPNYRLPEDINPRVEYNADVISPNQALVDLSRLGTNPDGTPQIEKVINLAETVATGTNIRYEIDWEASDPNNLISLEERDEYLIQNGSNLVIPNKSRGLEFKLILKIGNEAGFINWGVDIVEPSTIDFSTIYTFPRTIDAVEQIEYNLPKYYTLNTGNTQDIIKFIVEYVTYNKETYDQRIPINNYIHTNVDLSAGMYKNTENRAPVVLKNATNGNGKLILNPEYRGKFYRIQIKAFIGDIPTNKTIDTLTNSDLRSMQGGYKELQIPITITELSMPLVELRDIHDNNIYITSGSNLENVYLQTYFKPHPLTSNLVIPPLSQSRINIISLSPDISPPAISDILIQNFDQPTVSQSSTNILSLQTDFRGGTYTITLDATIHHYENEAVTNSDNRLIVNITEDPPVRLTGSSTRSIKLNNNTDSIEVSQFFQNNVISKDETAILRIDNGLQDIYDNDETGELETAYTYNPETYTYTFRGDYRDFLDTNAKIIKLNAYVDRYPTQKQSFEIIVSEERFEKATISKQTITSTHPPPLSTTPSITPTPPPSITPNISISPTISTTIALPDLTPFQEITIDLVEYFQDDLDNRRLFADITFDISNIQQLNNLFSGFYLFPPPTLDTNLTTLTFYTDTRDRDYSIHLNLYDKYQKKENDQGYIDVFEIKISEVHPLFSLHPDLTIKNVRRNTCNLDIADLFSTIVPDTNLSLSMVVSPSSPAPLTGLHNNQPAFTLIGDSNLFISGDYRDTPYTITVVATLDEYTNNPLEATITVEEEGVPRITLINPTISSTPTHIYTDLKISNVESNLSDLFTIADYPYSSNTLQYDISVSGDITTTHPTININDLVIADPVEDTLTITPDFRNTSYTVDITVFDPVEPQKSSNIIPLTLEIRESSVITTLPTKDKLTYSSLSNEDVVIDLTEVFQNNHPYRTDITYTVSSNLYDLDHIINNQISYHRECNLFTLNSLENTITIHPDYRSNIDRPYDITVYASMPPYNDDCNVIISITEKSLPEIVFNDKHVEDHIDETTKPYRCNIQTYFDIHSYPYTGSLVFDTSIHITETIPYLSNINVDTVNDDDQTKNTFTITPDLRGITYDVSLRVYDNTTGIARDETEIIQRVVELPPIDLGIRKVNDQDTSSRMYIDISNILADGIKDDNENIGDVLKIIGDTPDDWLRAPLRNLIVSNHPNTNCNIFYSTSVSESTNPDDFIEVDEENELLIFKPSFRNKTTDISLSAYLEGYPTQVLKIEWTIDEITDEIRLPNEFTYKIPTLSNLSHKINLLNDINKVYVDYLGTTYDSSTPAPVINLHTTFDHISIDNSISISGNTRYVSQHPATLPDISTLVSLDYDSDTQLLTVNPDLRGLSYDIEIVFKFRNDQDMTFKLIYQVDELPPIRDKELTTSLEDTFSNLTTDKITIDVADYFEEFHSSRNISYKINLDDITESKGSHTGSNLFTRDRPNERFTVNADYRGTYYEVSVDAFVEGYEAQSNTVILHFHEEKLPLLDDLYCNLPVISRPDETTEPFSYDYAKFYKIFEHPYNSTFQYNLYLHEDATCNIGDTAFTIIPKRINKTYNVYLEVNDIGYDNTVLDSSCNIVLNVIELSLAGEGAVFESSYTLSNNQKSFILNEYFVFDGLSPSYAFTVSDLSTNKMIGIRPYQSIPEYTAYDYNTLDTILPVSENLPVVNIIKTKQNIDYTLTFGTKLGDPPPPTVSYNETPTLFLGSTHTIHYPEEYPLSLETQLDYTRNTNSSITITIPDNYDYTNTNSNIRFGSDHTNFISDRDFLISPRITDTLVVSPEHRGDTYSVVITTTVNDGDQEQIFTKSFSVVEETLPDISLEITSPISVHDIKINEYEVLIKSIVSTYPYSQHLEYNLTSIHNNTRVDPTKFVVIPNLRGGDPYTVSLTVNDKYILDNSLTSNILTITELPPLSLESPFPETEFSNLSNVPKQITISDYIINNHPSVDFTFSLSYTEEFGIYSLLPNITSNEDTDTFTFNPEFRNKTTNVSLTVNVSGYDDTSHFATINFSFTEVSIEPYLNSMFYGNSYPIQKNALTTSTISCNITDFYNTSSYPYTDFLEYSVYPVEYTSLDTNNKVTISPNLRGIGYDVYVEVSDTKNTSLSTCNVVMNITELPPINQVFRYEVNVANYNYGYIFEQSKQLVDRNDVLETGYNPTFHIYLGDEIVITNEVNHPLAIENDQNNKLVDQNESEIKYRFLELGTYTYYCTIRDHKENMNGQIIVSHPPDLTTTEDTPAPLTLEYSNQTNIAININVADYLIDNHPDSNISFTYRITSNGEATTNIREEVFYDLSATLFSSTSDTLTITPNYRNDNYTVEITAEIKGYDGKIAINVDVEELDIPELGSIVLTEVSSLNNLSLLLYGTPIKNSFTTYPYNLIYSNVFHKTVIHTMGDPNGLPEDAINITSRTGAFSIQPNLRGAEYTLYFSAEDPQFNNKTEDITLEVVEAFPLYITQSETQLNTSHRNSPLITDYNEFFTKIDHNSLDGINIILDSIVLDDLITNDITPNIADTYLSITFVVAETPTIDHTIITIGDLNITYATESFSLYSNTTPLTSQDITTNLPAQITFTIQSTPTSNIINSYTNTDTNSTIEFIQEPPLHLQNQNIMITAGTNDTYSNIRVYSKELSITDIAKITERKDIHSLITSVDEVATINTNNEVIFTPNQRDTTYTLDVYGYLEGYEWYNPFKRSDIREKAGIGEGPQNFDYTIDFIRKGTITKSLIEIISEIEQDDSLENDLINLFDFQSISILSTPDTSKDLDELGFSYKYDTNDKSITVVSDLRNIEYTVSLVIVDQNNENTTYTFNITVIEPPPIAIADIATDYGKDTTTGPLRPTDTVTINQLIFTNYTDGDLTYSISVSGIDEDDRLKNKHNDLYAIQYGVMDGDGTTLSNMTTTSTTTFTDPLSNITINPEYRGVYQITLTATPDNTQYDPVAITLNIREETFLEAYSNIFVETTFQDIVYIQNHDDVINVSSNIVELLKIPENTYTYQDNFQYSVIGVAKETTTQIVSFNANNKLLYIEKNVSIDTNNDINLPTGHLGYYYIVDINIADFHYPSELSNTAQIYVRSDRLLDTSSKDSTTKTLEYLTSVVQFENLLNYYSPSTAPSHNYDIKLNVISIKKDTIVTLDTTDGTFNYNIDSNYTMDVIHNSHYTPQYLVENTSYNMTGENLKIVNKIPNQDEVFAINPEYRGTSYDVVWSITYSNLTLSLDQDMINGKISVSESNLPELVFITPQQIDTISDLHITPTAEKAIKNYYDISTYPFKNSLKYQVITPYPNMNTTPELLTLDTNEDPTDTFSITPDLRDNAYGVYLRLFDDLIKHNVDYNQKRDVSNLVLNVEELPPLYLLATNDTQYKAVSLQKIDTLQVESIKIDADLGTLIGINHPHCNVDDIVVSSLRMVDSVNGEYVYHTTTNPSYDHSTDQFSLDDEALNRQFSKTISLIYTAYLPGYQDQTIDDRFLFETSNNPSAGSEFIIIVPKFTTAGYTSNYDFNNISTDSSVVNDFQYIFEEYPVMSSNIESDTQTLNAIADNSKVPNFTVDLSNISITGSLLGRSYDIKVKLGTEIASVDVIYRVEENSPVMIKDTFATIYGSIGTNALRPNDIQTITGPFFDIYVDQSTSIIYSLTMDNDSTQEDLRYENKHKGGYGVSYATTASTTNYTDITNSNTITDIDDLDVISIVPEYRGSYDITISAYANGYESQSNTITLNINEDTLAAAKTRLYTNLPTTTTFDSGEVSFYCNLPELLNITVNDYEYIGSFSYVPTVRDNVFGLNHIKDNTELYLGGNEREYIDDTNNDTNDEARFSSITDLVLSSDDKWLYVCDTYNNKAIRRVRVKEDGHYVRGYTETIFNIDTDTNIPQSICLSPNDQVLYILLANENKIYKVPIESSTQHTQTLYDISNILSFLIKIVISRDGTKIYGITNKQIYIITIGDETFTTELLAGSSLSSYIDDTNNDTNNEAAFIQIKDLALSSDNKWLYVCDTNGIRRVKTTIDNSQYVRGYTETVYYNSYVNFDSITIRDTDNLYFSQNQIIKRMNIQDINVIENVSYGSTYKNITVSLLEDKIFYIDNYEIRALNINNYTESYIVDINNKLKYVLANTTVNTNDDIHITKGYLGYNYIIDVSITDPHYIELNATTQIIVKSERLIEHNPISLNNYTSLSNVVKFINISQQYTVSDNINIDEYVIYLDIGILKKGEALFNDNYTYNANNGLLEIIYIQYSSPVIHTAFYTDQYPTSYTIPSTLEVANKISDDIIAIHPEYRGVSYDVVWSVSYSNVSRGFYQDAIHGVINVSELDYPVDPIQYLLSSSNIFSELAYGTTETCNVLNMFSYVFGNEYLSLTRVVKDNSENEITDDADLLGDYNFIDSSNFSITSAGRGEKYYVDIIAVDKLISSISLETRVFEVVEEVPFTVSGSPYTHPNILTTVPEIIDLSQYVNNKNNLQIIWQFNGWGGGNTPRDHKTNTNETLPVNTVGSNVSSNVEIYPDLRGENIAFHIKVWLEGFEDKKKPFTINYTEEEPIKAPVGNKYIIHIGDVRKNKIWEYAVNDLNKFEEDITTTDRLFYLNKNNVYFFDNNTNYTRYRGSYLFNKNEQKIYDPVNNGMVSTLAGNGIADFVDGDIDTAQFNRPTGVAVSPDGVWVYVADSNNHRIRKVQASDGEVSTLAGSGRTGLGNGGFVDGGAGSAQFKNPSGVAVSPDGLWVYVADTNNHRIRKVRASDGEVSTLAGDGTFGLGDVDSAKFNSPHGVAVSPDGLWIYVADIVNQLIRSYTDTNIIEYVLRDGSAGYYVFYKESTTMKLSRINSNNDEEEINNDLGINSIEYVVKQENNLFIVVDEYNVKWIDLDDGGNIRDFISGPLIYAFDIINDESYSFITTNKKIEYNLGYRDLKLRKFKSNDVYIYNNIFYINEFIFNDHDGSSPYTIEYISIDPTNIRGPIYEYSVRRQYDCNIVDLNTPFSQNWVVLYPEYRDTTYTISGNIFYGIYDDNYQKVDIDFIVTEPPITPATFKNNGKDDLVIDLGVLYNTVYYDNPIEKINYILKDYDGLKIVVNPLPNQVEIVNNKEIIITVDENTPSDEYTLVFNIEDSKWNNEVVNTNNNVHLTYTIKFSVSDPEDIVRFVEDDGVVLWHNYNLNALSYNVVNMNDGAGVDLLANISSDPNNDLLESKLLSLTVNIDEPTYSITKTYDKESKPGLLIDVDSLGDNIESVNIVLNLNDSIYGGGGYKTKYNFETVINTLPNISYYREHNLRIKGITHSPNGEYLYMTSEGGSILRYRFSDKTTEVFIVLETFDVLTDIVISNDGKWIYVVEIQQHRIMKVRISDKEKRESMIKTG